MITHVYIADVSVLLDEGMYNTLRNLVPEDRRAKADSMKFAKGRAQSLGAGLLLHEVCRELAACKPGFEDADQHIIIGEYEKPDFHQAWLAERGFGQMHFSLSHSGDRVMCGISGAPIGCDVEVIKDRDMKIAKRFFREEEYADIMAQPDNAKADRFFRYWTLKESVVKCEGQGLSMALDSFRIRIDEDGASVDGLKGECTLREFQLNDGYKYSCCVAAEAAEIQQKYIDICGLK